MAEKSIVALADLEGEKVVGNDHRTRLRKESRVDVATRNRGFDVTLPRCDGLLIRADISHIFQGAGADSPPILR